jgi:hypothetical protein
MRKIKISSNMAVLIVFLAVIALMIIAKVLFF